MFTGIIEAVGQLKKLVNCGSDYQVEISTNGLDLADVKLGDSIASNGICLTVVKLTPSSFFADVSSETIRLTGFANYQLGQKINLEKAVTPTTRLGGHMVSGHVDGVGTVERIISNGRSTDYWIKAPTELMRYIAHKGSITVDGISLTVNGLEQDSLRLTIVPHTASETTISQFRIGSRVNLEVDQIARYLERLMQVNKQEQQGSVTMDLLARSGFLK
ncbi:MAG: riboflavin synthase [Gammaproteobacteria bacterium]|nr:riboflavin synthase [Gammaproteobacteria bacterium]